MSDIMLATDDGDFHLRSLGLLFYENNILLVHCPSGDYILPGGRVELMEDTKKTIVREIKEEADINVSIERLLFISEGFNISPIVKSRRSHEVCFYYLLSCNTNSIKFKYEMAMIDKPSYKLCWIPIANAKEIKLFPAFLAHRLECLPITLEHIIET